MHPSLPPPALHPSTSTSLIPAINNPKRNSSSRSTSQCRSSNSSTTTIDFTQKLTLQDPIKHPPTNPSPETNPRIHETPFPRLQDGLSEPGISEDWVRSTESDLLNIDEFKERMARAKHWRERKIELKELVAKLRSEGTSRKFEIEIKGIGR